MGLPVWPELSGPALTVSPGGGGLTVTVAVSETGRLMPSLAVSVAAKVPATLQSMTVSALESSSKLQLGLSTVHWTVGVLSGSETEPCNTMSSFTSPLTLPPTFTVGGTFGVVTVTVAVSCTGGLTPSFAVNVAATVPTAVHVMVVTAAVASANVQPGVSEVHTKVGVPKGSSAEPFNVIAVLTSPETAPPALTVVCGPDAAMFVVVSVSGGTLQTTGMGVPGGVVPTFAVVVSWLKLMVTAPGALGAMTLIVVSGVDRSPGASGPGWASVTVVFPAPKVVVPVTTFPLFVTGPVVDTDVGSNVPPPFTAYVSDRFTKLWMCTAPPSALLGSVESPPGKVTGNEAFVVESVGASSAPVTDCACPPIGLLQVRS